MVNHARKNLAPHAVLLKFKSDDARNSNGYSLIYISENNQKAATHPRALKIWLACIASSDVIF